MSTAAGADELDQLLGLLVDDLLDDRELARLEDLLTGQPAARRRYRSYLALHSTLHWDYAAAARVQALEAAVPARAPVRTHALRWPAAAAAAVLLVAALGFGWRALPREAPAILTAGEVAGGVLTWSDGARHRELFGGEALGPGQLRLEGPTASASVRFRDGSMVSLAGESELSVSDDGQKRLQLTAGALTADVQPQPVRQPLLVRTGTAELEVVGTRFTVTASATQTTLDVERGRVRLERLVDGQVTEVAAQQNAVASLDAASPLRASAHYRPPTAWALDLLYPPPPTWVGTYIAASAEQPALMRAAPYLAGRSPAGVPLTHFGVRIGTGEVGAHPFVRLLAGSHVVVRLRTTRPEGMDHVNVMICTHTATGAFGGTFTAAIPVAATDAAGWRTVRLAVEDFKPLRPTQPSMVDLDAVFILPRTTTAAIGLELAALAVEAP